MTKKRFNTILVLDLPRVFRNKGIDKPVAWMMAQGMSNNIAHKLLRGKFKRGAPIYHLATICQKLWCTPNELFTYLPSPAEDLPGHPLEALKRTPDEESLKKILEKMPEEKIAEVKKFARGIKKS